ncbi:hypothetical protein GCM10009733_026020 [Nonomuraea maheshkhaliensis]|uniref:HTH arsR-type domain-containing protein n=1 Tax=Nonomuraea maheshkhaliensis TaxID=419590 RepID=A0ABP4R3C1_9ACTN
MTLCDNGAEALLRIGAERPDVLLLTARLPGAPGRSSARVHALAEAFDVAEPTISHHLKALRDAGLPGCEAARASARSGCRPRQRRGRGERAVG